MRSSCLLVFTLLAGCARESKVPFEEMVVLPIENLTADASGAVDAAALQRALWASLQAQPALHALMVGHRREIAGLAPDYLVEGYVAHGRFLLQLNGKMLPCDGTLETCAPRLVKEVAAIAGVTPRPVPSAETLRFIAASGVPGRPAPEVQKALAADPLYSDVWLVAALQAQSQEGVSAALETLGRAPLDKMSPYDAARIKLRSAELRQERTAFAQALGDLARLSPVDNALQDAAARASSASGDLAGALQIYERLIARDPQPTFLNQAAYLAAFVGDRSKAESYADRAVAAAQNDPSYLDTRGDIAYFFGDFEGASRRYEQAAGLNVAFQNGLDLWKAADAARRAGKADDARALLGRYLEFRTKSGQRNTLILEAVWAWQGGVPGEAAEKLHAAEETTQKTNALFLEALMALSERDQAAARRIHQRMDQRSIEHAFLRSLIDGAPVPAGFPVPPGAIEALHAFLHGDNAKARELFTAARKGMDPFTEGQWRKFAAIVDGKKPDHHLPPGPDDWLAVLLR